MHRRAIAGAALSLFVASSAFAGWVIESTTRYFGEEGMAPERGENKTTYLQDNKMKVVEVGEQTVIFDVGKGEMLVLVPERKIYFGGKPEDIVNATKAMADMMKQAMMAQMTPEQRKAYEQYMEQAPEEQAGPKKTYELKKTGEQATVAGYPATKYEVRVDGELDQELWVSSKVNPGDEIDMDAVKSMLRAMRPPGEEEQFEMSDDYVELMRQGIPLKEVHYQDGRRAYVDETTRVEKKDIPASEFAPPEDYKRVTLEEAFGHMMEGGE